MTRLHRVRAFCDWLDTIPPDPPFFNHPDFGQFSDLTDGEIMAADAEMRNRAAAHLAEAAALEVERLRRAQPASANDDDPEPDDAA